MAQIKVYGLKESLHPIKNALSEVIHSCTVDALNLPREKRFHRFFLMDKEDLYFPDTRTDAYTVIEVSMFEGRTIKAKKQFIHLLFERINREFHISEQDIEITIFETPMHNWGIRGVPADELSLTYKVDV